MEQSTSPAELVALGVTGSQLACVNDVEGTDN